MPKVSIIMGVFNPKNENMLKNSVRSILNQTLKDIEFIICDDGCNEAAKKWIENLKQYDTRIKIIRNSENRGLAFSLNKCLKLAKGKYIARQDADDYSNTERLEKQYNFLEQHCDFAMTGTNINLFDEKKVFSAFKFPEYPKKNDFLFCSPFNHGSIMIRKEVIDRLKGYNTSKQTRRCEDYDLFIRLYLNGYKAYNIQEYLYNFREDKAAKKRRKFKDRIDEAKVRYKYFKKMGFGIERFFYIIKPVLVGLLPINVIDFLKKIYYKNRKSDYND